MGYSFRLTARVILYAPSLRQDNTYHGLCYTSRRALAGTRNSSMGPPHEGSIRRPIAPWANALTYIVTWRRTYEIAQSGIDPTTHRTKSRHSTTKLGLAARTPEIRTSQDRTISVQPFFSSEKCVTNDTIKIMICFFQSGKINKNLFLQRPWYVLSCLWNGVYIYI